MKTPNITGGYSMYGLFFLMLMMMTTACSVNHQYHKGKLVWKDNFNNKKHFNSRYWSKIPRGTADWNRHMSDLDDCYDMRNGKLILRGILNNGKVQDTARFLTGGIYTKDKISFGYGRWEIRAKLNAAKGAWPAFWLLAQDGKWPEAGEVDIMERLNHDSIAYQTVHSYYTHRLNIKDNPKHGSTGKIDPDAFNTYAVELHPDKLVFFINNKQTFSYPRIKTDKEGQFPFTDYKYYLLLDMQLGGSWVGNVDSSHLPVEMEIDWVKFYSFKN
ncbi:glycoside hydrolase family 16 protein [Elizabethkingia meningoseptica]|uniref:glycoside hydrolase family 16 protein n=1 Tax=Elizabethkingia meningoseptica TaxID=238 RepID=UPI003892B42E